MKHIRLYFFVLFTACSMFMVCPFAYADSMASNIYDTALSEFSTWSGYNNGLTFFSQAASECQYVFIGVSGSYKVIYFSSVPDPVIFWDNSSRLFMPYNTINDIGTGGSIGSISQYSSSTPFILYGFCDNGSGAFSCSYKAVLTNYNSQSNSRQSYNYYGYQTFSFSSLYGSLQYNYSSNRNNIVRSNSYGSFHFFTNTWIHTTSNLEPVLYTEDERLKFAIVDNIYGGKNLMTDIRQFINDFPIQDTSHSSVLLYPENITLTYIVDNVEKTLSLSSSNSTIKSKYIFETDLSNFDFDESADNVIITKCDFTISGNTQSGQSETETYKISCDYYIKRYIQPIEQGSNPYESNLNGDQTSQETKDSLQYLVTFREGYGLDFDEFSDLSFPDYYTYADVYLYNNTAAYNYLMDNILSVNAVAYVIQSLANSEEDVITQIGLFLDDSNYGEYYDVIVFDWIQETSSTYTHTYFYFETVSGRVKATTQFLQVMQDDLNKVKINTAAAFTAIDNFEAESIQFFNAKLGLDADLLGWVKTIDNSINNLDFPVYDDSNILSLLGQIKDLLSSPANEIDTPQECIQLYEAHPDYFNELWGNPTRSRAATNQFSGSEYVRADLVPAWWEGKTLTMIYILKNDGETSRFYNDILNGLFDSYENLIESDNSFNTFIDSLFKTGYDYTDSFYGHFFDLDYNPEAWDGGFADNE